jgi:3-oxoacyl-[acyl-carrier protein] reductase
MLASRAVSSSQMTAEVEAQITRSVPIRRLAEPEEIADVIVFLASQRASYITGTLLPVDGGVVQSPT